MSEAFIVTSGVYSDYKIERVFSTKEKALEYIDTKDDSYKLEEFDIDEPVVRESRVYEVSFDLEKKQVHNVRIMWSQIYKDLIIIKSRFPYIRETLCIYVESDSRERALKVASERYGAIIANERTMYSYLRLRIIGHLGNARTAHYDFNTGEMVLLDNDALTVEVPPFVKVRRERVLYNNQ